MDESWNFLKEAPESELALIRNACNKCGIQISPSASAEQVVTSILGLYELEKDNSYEGFLDKVCEELSLNIDDGGVEKKETILLETFLVEGIRKMDDEQLRGFAMSYGFSNLDAEKLIREVRARLSNSRARLSNSEELSQKLSVIDSTLFGVNSESVFPCHSVATNLSLKEEQYKDSNLNYAALITTLMLLRQFHHNIDIDYLKDYLDLIVSNDESFKGNESKAYLSIMLNVCRLFKHGLDCTTFEETFRYLNEKEIIIPAYLTNELSKEGCLDIANYILEKVFPCDEKQQASYKDTNESTNCLTKGNGCVAFFDYMFPYTNPSNGTYFAMPDEEEKQYYSKLYLLFFDKNLNDCLVDKKQLLEKEIDCAVVSYCDDYTFKHPINTIYTEDRMIEGWKTFFRFNSENTKYIEGIEVLVEFLTIFVSKHYKKIIPRLMEIVDSMNDKNEVLNKFKLFMHSINDNAHGK